MNDPGLRSRSSFHRGARASVHRVRRSSVAGAHVLGASDLYGAENTPLALAVLIKPESTEVRLHTALQALLETAVDAEGATLLREAGALAQCAQCLRAHAGQPKVVARALHVLFMLVRAAKGEAEYRPEELCAPIVMTMVQHAKEIELLLVRTVAVRPLFPPAWADATWVFSTNCADSRELVSSLLPCSLDFAFSESLTLNPLCRRGSGSSRCFAQLMQHSWLPSKLASPRCAETTTPLLFFESLFRYAGSHVTDGAHCCRWLQCMNGSGPARRSKDLLFLVSLLFSPARCSWLQWQILLESHPLFGFDWRPHSWRLSFVRGRLPSILCWSAQPMPLTFSALILSSRP